MEFHNIFGCAHGESKLQDNSRRDTCSNFQTKTILEKQGMRQQKTEHNSPDQGSLNKQSACSWTILASTLAPYQRGIIFFWKYDKKFIQVLSLENAWTVELLEYVQLRTIAAI